MSFQNLLIPGAALGAFMIPLSAAYAQSPEAGPLDTQPVEAPAPVPHDTDGDGKADAWDRDGDGRLDAWDTDGDGQPDTFDDDGDGAPDTPPAPPPPSEPEAL